MDSLPKDEFIRAWSSLAYLFPQLHPDSWDEPDGGWPASLVPLATEAWRRIEAGELDGDEVYPSDAQWCGLYDQMSEHTPDELEHRRKLALLCRGSIDG
ncbi:MAG: hypothetical protein IT446_02355 [Phycisphaerales bacterium]|nr:hypothetical protein [Phycisphaerales bacterium]